MTYKEFYYWLDGFVTNRHWTQYRREEVDLILEKMKEVKDEPEIETLKRHDWVPTLPINPFPNETDPYKPPYEVYCGTKENLND
jgi:hypothetical protein